VSQRDQAGRFARCSRHPARDRDLRRRGGRLVAFCASCFKAAWKRHREKDPEKWRAIDRRRKAAEYAAYKGRRERVA